MGFFVPKNAVRNLAQEHASDVLKRRWPRRYIGRPIISVKDCVAGLIEMGALSREIVEISGTEIAIVHWCLARIESKPKKLDQDPGFYRSAAWRKLRFSVLVECGARCSACGVPACEGVVLHVDHIKPRSKFPELALDPANLQVLCED